MRDKFPGYFDPTKEEIARVWTTGTIALDTNVLLGLYKMPEQSRSQACELLQKVRDRLFVPYHVLVEFNRNRLDVMRSEFSESKQLGRDARTAYDAFKAVINNDRVKERACWPQLSEKLSEMTSIAEDLFKITKSESAHYVSPNAEDRVLSFVENLVSGQMGSRPTGQDEVTKAEDEARARFAVGMGPGSSDQDKAGDIYSFDGLTYESQFGDYLVWKELIASSREKNVKALMLITSDVKPDWWLDSKSVSGKRPQPELVMEMRREAGVESFWMYTLSDFMRQANVHLQAKVEEKAITDARQAEAATRRANALYHHNPPDRRFLSPGQLESVLESLAAEIISVRPNIGGGFRMRPDGARSAVVTVSAEYPLTKAHAFRADLKSLIDTLDLFYTTDLLDVYVLFGTSNQRDILSQMSVNEVKRSIKRIEMPMSSIKFHIGCFTDPSSMECLLYPID